MERKFCSIFFVCSATGIDVRDIVFYNLTFSIPEIQTPRNNDNKKKQYKKF